MDIGTLLGHTCGHQDLGVPNGLSPVLGGTPFIVEVYSWPKGQPRGQSTQIQINIISHCAQCCHKLGWMTCATECMPKC